MCWGGEGSVHFTVVGLVTLQKRKGVAGTLERMPHKLEGQERCVCVDVRRGQLRWKPFPLLLCLSLNMPSLSTLGIQEKYLASSDQTTEQEAMQL